jgi:peptide/nickel transport system permease protein
LRPPLTIVFEHYRDLERQGQVEAVWHAFVPYSPNDRLRDMPEERLQPPGRRHLMGTDPNGADVMSRMIHASRIALSIGFIATGIAVFIGVIVGGVMGYFAGWIDLVGMRLIEIIEAIPTLVLLVAVTTFYGRSLYLMMVVIGLLSWTGDARFIRAEFLRLRGQDFVQAAMALGLPLRSILFRHMLPNGITPVLVGASFGVASAILLESTLSFLGLGLVDEPSWGQMLNQARFGSGFVWWMATFPGVAIFLTVFAYNLVGEALRDALDPRLRI